MWYEENVIGKGKMGWKMWESLSSEFKFCLGISNVIYFHGLPQMHPILFISTLPIL